MKYLLALMLFLSVPSQAETCFHLGMATKTFARQRQGLTFDLYTVHLTDRRNTTPIRLNLGASLFQRTAHDFDRTLLGVQVNLSLGLFFVGLNFNDTASGDMKVIAGVRLF